MEKQTSWKKRAFTTRKREQYTKVSEKCKEKFLFILKFGVRTPQRIKNARERI